MVRQRTVIRTLILCCLATTTLAFAKTNKSKTIVTYPSGFAVSQPVSELPVDFSMFPGQEMPEPRPNPNKSYGGPWLSEDPVLQKETLQPLAAGKGIDFEGIASNGYAPSDSNMAIGPNDIVETVNVLFEVFNKSGSSLAGPTSIQTLFAPLGGVCASTYGDPIVLYDRPADRWLISMIGGSGAYGECIAVSKTNDPAGTYYLYAYSFGSNLNDYPKLSTWATPSNSAYLATYDIFLNGQSFGGSDLCGFDRTKMLAGNSTAAQLCKMTPSSEFSYLPSDMDGPTPPADGTPGLFIHPNGSNQLYLRKLTLNFASGTATLSSPTTISVASYAEACHSSCVPQSGTTQLLDALGDLTMYRFAVRHFADHDRAVVNDSVVNGSQVAVRWYELYDPAGSVTLNQQGTFAPDSTYRWMASIAEDKNGDIGVGYSASSSSINPAIRFTGRVPTDPAGTLETEASLLVGTGSQLSGLSRWGDYTAMQVDPSDDCTFWYVDQYEKVSGTFNWHTNIGSFKFETCTTGPDFTLSVTPSSQTIFPGSGTSFTATVSPLDGFTGTVALGVTGLPTGATGTFNPTSISGGSGSSVLNITTSNTTPKGTYTLTITGTSGALVHKATVTLVVSGGWAWTLSGTAFCGTTEEQYSFFGFQSAPNSLQWFFLVETGDPANGQYNWTLYDTSGTFASGSYCGSEYCNPPTGNNGSSITATRLPVGTPSFRVYGQFTINGSCSTQYSGSVQMHP